MKKYTLFGLVSLCWIACQPSAPYRDLNKNGKMDPYEDASQPIDKRVEDLLSQMTLEEKAGQMFINGAGIYPDGSLVAKPGMKLVGPAANVPPVDSSILHLHMTHFNFWITPPPRELAMGVNAIQKLAESTRLGIPVTLASDPRHYFSNNIFTMSANGFSIWPEQLGFAALGDSALMRQFADIARQEYLAVGIREALHPMADLATEPRWPRCNGTFGEDAALSARMLKPYILGFQNGNGLNAGSVACMTKHFPGGGPQKEGLDPHFEIQKGQVYPGNHFDYHMQPFFAAFEANTAAIMPYYGVPVDQTTENVGFSYNREVITGLLRNRFKYNQVVCTDWGLVTDKVFPSFTWHARAWGVENLSREQRVKKIIEAGCDQFGGESCPELVVSLVRSGQLSEARINLSVRRLLRQKFQLGLFENPFVDAEHVAEKVGKPEWMALGRQTQSRSLTLLKNEGSTLPLAPKKYKVYLRNVRKEALEPYATVVDKPEHADFAIVRASTPWVPMETANVIAKGFHHGDLDFKGRELEDLLALCRKVPVIFDLYIDRPAVFPEINQAAKAVLADYGASDEAVLDVIFGKVAPEGKLPFELPSSMEAVRYQKEDLPHDSRDPLYPFGFGLRYR